MGAPDIISSLTNAGFLDVVGSIVTGGLGGIVGAAGAVAGKVIDLKLEGEKRETLKVTQAHELALREADRVLAAQEAASQFSLHKVDADSAAVLADLGALSASVEADRATYGDSTLGRIVDAFRGSVRPGVTLWAVALTSYVTWEAFRELLGQPLGADRALALVRDAEFLAGLAISWWFGSRPNRSK